MKTKTGMSLMMALLMVVSTFVVGAVNSDECDEEGDFGILNGELCWPFGEVVKEIYDGEGWVDVYTAELDEIVHFRITLTYYNTGHPNAQYAKNITAVDTLPDCLKYDSAYPDPTSVDGQIIAWDFGDLTLCNGYSIVILLNATVVSYTDQDGEDNLVEVNATEKCSDRDLYGSDIATVICEEPPCEEGIEVEKKVLVDDEWVDSIGDLILGDIVTFKITVTYKDCDPLETIVCLEAIDYLPCCLDFAGGVSYDGSTFTVPAIDPVVDGKIITWSWTGTDTIQMNDGDILVITFDAEVTRYCQEQDTNYVEVFAWTCCDDFYGDDYVDVDCTPPESTFEKKVWDELTEQWADEGVGIVGEEMTFKLEFEYHGNEELVDLRFKDEMPCVLEFSEVVESTINISVDVSEDNKTVWFNMSEDTVTDGFVTIIFTALVTGVTGDCCPDPVDNKAWLLVIYPPAGEVIEYYDEVSIQTRRNSAPYAPSILDDIEGEAGETLTFYITGTDPDEDDLYYYIDWDDGTYEEWVGPYTHGAEIEITHEWEDHGDYTVKIKSKDVWGKESAWGNEITVTIKGHTPTDLEVSIKRGLSRGVKVTLTNNMETDINDIVWDLRVSKRLLGRTLYDNNGTIETLVAGNSTEIGGLTKFGFGLISVEINVSAMGIDPIIKTAKGFILGKFVYLR